MKNYSSLIIALFVLLITSCKSVNNDNVFSKLNPSSVMYQKELVKLFLDNGTANFTFNFDGLVKFSGKDYMQLAITGGGVAAKTLVLINNWNKLEDIKRTKGLGYYGAELKNIRLDMININQQPVFVYRDLEKIID